ncbi:MAG: GNAT family N-acetyltransferase [Desulfobacteraceae bacterium]|nr:GNAT family N-acetyltransferase [Desulfobacteraceae bacterium]
MIIRQFTSTDAGGWDHYVLNHPRGMLNHLLAWKTAVEKAYGFKSCYMMAEKVPGGRIVGILPLIHHHFPFLKGELISLPFCDSAGSLADSPAIEKELMRGALEIAKSKGISRIVIRSSTPLGAIEKERALNDNKVRMVLKLPRDSATLLASFKAKLRSQVKKPMRDGLTSQIGGKELLREFYPLFSENMRDLGSPVHSARWLRAVLESFGSRAHLFLVRMPDNSPAAGGILLCHPNQVSVPWASSLRRFNRWNPNMLLYWSFLKFACDMGYPLFDFGRSSPGEGTYRFKMQWGAKPAPLFWFSIAEKMAIKKAGNGFNSGLAARVGDFWSTLPVSVSRGLGPALRRYIDL